MFVDHFSRLSGEELGYIFEKIDDPERCSMWGGPVVDSMQLEKGL